MAGIIKSGDPAGRTLGASSAAFNFSDLRDQAGNYLQTVQEKAQKIVADAQAQGAEIQRNAAISGKAAAEKAAKKLAQDSAAAQVREQLQTLLPALNKLMSEVDQARLDWRGRWQENVVDLAVAIAERVIRRELAAQPQITLDLVQEALELASGVGKVRIRLHPQDHQALGAEVQSLAAAFQKISSAEVVADPKIERGGCVLQTDFGEIDQQIPTQLARLKQELVD
ncbi:FliH/SctL family protein [Lignipirellula cremea]|uniref:Flagellar assembly protein FliH n=1 Tax=Lignipirellula cremea TaxID=2528010 RepID=A0A518DRX6_9BACT|nr:FliH/SctL family protein [Lignipirellula cremea]QDU94586.1 Yop proteins translocation protein L [Lignipirellula cremea]